LKKNQRKNKKVAADIRIMENHSKYAVFLLPPLCILTHTQTLKHTYTYIHTKTILSLTHTSTYKWPTHSKRARVWNPDIRESDIIAIGLNISICTSKKTRSCLEVCLEGSTPRVGHYDQDA
jgi:hypothetical protein